MLLGYLSLADFIIDIRDALHDGDHVFRMHSTGETPGDLIRLNQWKEAVAQAIAAA